MTRPELIEVTPAEYSEYVRSRPELKLVGHTGANIWLDPDGQTVATFFMGEYGAPDCCEILGRLDCAAGGYPV